MKGGEIFVPKIPSAKIIDIAESIAPNLPLKIVGIRPGEKLHEVMCPTDDSINTIEFDDHYVISPSIVFHQRGEYTTNQLNEVGVNVELGFEYESGTNKDFLSVEELIKFNKTL